MEHKQILIVEDDRSIRDLYALILRRLKIDFDFATDGQMAVDKLANTSYELVLLDLMIPKLSGFSVLQFIRDQVRPKPAVLVTTGAVDEFRRRADAALVTGIISKPFDLAEMTGQIQRALHFEPEKLSA